MHHPAIADRGDGAVDDPVVSLRQNQHDDDGCRGDHGHGGDARRGPPGQGPAAAVCVLLRFIREAVNQLLPVGQVGGDVVGARLATFWRVDGALASAATVALPET